MRNFLKIISFFLLVSTKVLSFEEPHQYLTLSAEKKMDTLWSLIEKTKYTELPEYEKLGIKEVIKMAIQGLKEKNDLVSDFAPKDWVKYLHRRGSVAKVSYQPVKTGEYSGFFNGSKYSLLRLSITRRPSEKDAFAPGLALKVLRDGVSSGYVSALYTIAGQEDDYSFFKYPMSNIVVPGDHIRHKVIHRLFRLVSSRPEEIGLNNLSSYMEDGEQVVNSVSPRQIFFVPNEKLNFSNNVHDVRRDFHSIKKGTLIYKVYALAELEVKRQYKNYEVKNIQEFINQSVHIGNLISESSFISSEFGDDGLFFQHEVISK